MKKFKWAVLFFAVFGLVFAASAFSDSGKNDYKEYAYSPGGENVQAINYFKAPGFPPYPSRARFIGQLKGSWYEMGKQYGERCPDMIRVQFEGMLPDIKFDTPPYTHLKWDLAQYAEQISYFAPEMLEFITGIADGAASELNQSFYDAYFTNFEKVLFINCHSSLTFRHPPREAHAPGIWASSKINQLASAQNIVEEGCSAFAVVRKKGGAKDENTFSTQNRDIPFFPRTYEVVYIAKPDDPKANTFWALSSAGMIMANFIVNNRGMSIAHLSGGSSYAKDNAFGVPWPVRMTKAIISTKNRDDAIQLMTLGTPEYRAITGRKTVLRDGDSNTFVTDDHSTAVLELTARWYAVRYPGDYGEIGNYIVSANHFVCDKYSFDEDNVKHEGPEWGMTRFGDAAGYVSSGYRHATLMWLIKNNFGQIDEEMAQAFMTSHFYVTENGEVVDKVWNNTYGWVSARFASGNPTICRHTGGYPEGNKGNTNDGKVANLSKNIVYWTLGRPCDWVGPWSSVYMRPNQD